MALLHLLRRAFLTIHTLTIPTSGRWYQMYDNALAQVRTTFLFADKLRLCHSRAQNANAGSLTKS